MSEEYELSAQDIETLNAWKRFYHLDHQVPVEVLDAEQDRDFTSLHARVVDYLDSKDSEKAAAQRQKVGSDAVRDHLAKVRSGEATPGTKAYKESRKAMLQKQSKR